MLAYVHERREAPVIFDEALIQEAVRAGMLELVSIGVPQPYLVLTPAGLKHFRSTLRAARPGTRGLVRMPAR